MFRRIAATAIFAILVTVFYLPLPADAQTGLLVVAHGADSGWNARVEKTLAQVRWHAGPVRLAYLMGDGAEQHSWNAMVRELVSAGARTIVVVPLMVSTAGEHVEQIRYYAGELPAMPVSLMAMGMTMKHQDPIKPPVPMRVTSALDAAPELGSILLSRWQAFDEVDRKRPLMLVAHGPSADSLVPRWITSLDTTTKPLQEKLHGPVHVGLLRDDAPALVRAAAVQSIRDTINALARASHDSVTVMTVLISSGTINTIVVPNDLAGLPIRYFGVSLTPHEALARWIERTGRSVIGDR